MRHREYKVAHRPGSLRASVAAALGWLSQPGADDCVVDPMCGAGTILIERAHLGRYAMLAGFDRDPDAIAAAHENIGPRYRPMGLAQGDALRLPLGNGAATHLVTNLAVGHEVRIARREPPSLSAPGRGVRARGAAGRTAGDADGGADADARGR